MAYVFGNRDVNKSIKSNVEPSTDKIKDSVYRLIDGETWEDRVNKANTYEELERIVFTETHRDFSEGQYDTAIEGGATHKTWVTMGDDRVRDSHWYLDGLTVEVGEYFYTLAGERALYPRGFDVAEEDCNCRCFLEYSRRGES